MRIVVTRPIPEAGLDLLRPHHDVAVHTFDDGPGEEQLVEVGRGADVLLTLLSDPLTARVFEGCPRLKMVAQYAVGYDNVDLEAARARGIVVTNTPGVLTEATADFTWALLMAVTRRIVEADRFVRDGHFRRWETQALLGVELNRKTLGVVGMGRIGQAVARRALGFGMKVRYHNRHRLDTAAEDRLHARYVTLPELLAQSDVVTLHCALNEASHHLIDAAALAQMKPDAVLVNTARGAVVDEAALVEALQTGQIAGAGLDVFEHEPLVPAPLLEHPRVVVAPHLASATTEARTRMATMCAASILAFADGAEEIPHRLV